MNRCFCVSKKYIMSYYTTLWIFLVTSVFVNHAIMDFDGQMGFAMHDPYKKKNSETMKCLRQLFYQNYPLLSQPEKLPIIPKIIHLIWLGDQAPSELFYRCLESIRTHMPSWYCKIWRDEDVSQLKLINQNYFDAAQSYAEKADIVRYELLHEFGGLYLDTDVILIKSIEPLHYAYEFYVGIQPTDLRDELGNAVIGSVPGHPILKECIKGIKNAAHYSSVNKRTGPSFLKYHFLKQVKKGPERIIAFPKSCMYPLDFTKRHFSYEEALRMVTPESYTLHFWEGSWRDDKRGQP